jgi:DNA-binding FadR family transcriptional regulator
VIAKLISRGLCDTLPDGTAAVSEPYRWNVLDPDVVRAILELGDEERAAELVSGVLDALRLLECSASRFASRRITPADRDRLQRALAELQSQIDEDDEPRDGYVAARSAVHRAIVRASGRQPLVAAVEPLLDAFEAIGFAYRDPGESARSDPIELQLVVDAIVLNDRRHAAAMMGAHLRRLTRRLGGNPL